MTSLVCLAECYFLAQCYLFSRMLWYFLFCDLLSPKLSPQAWQNIYSCLFWILFLFFWFQRTVYLLTRSHNKSIIIQNSALIFIFRLLLSEFNEFVLSVRLNKEKIRYDNKCKLILEIMSCIQLILVYKEYPPLYIFRSPESLICHELLSDVRCVF